MGDKYVLKKDFLKMKADDILTKENAGTGYFNVDGHSWHERIHELTIRQHPDLFSKVKPGESNDSFTWTDELVLMLADLAHHNGYHRTHKAVTELFDEVKKQASGAGYKFSNWITAHLIKNKPEFGPVCGVNLLWEIHSHHSDLSQVMKASDCRFIGTRDECEAFIRWGTTDTFVSACTALDNIMKSAKNDTDGINGLWSIAHINTFQDELIKLGYSIQPVK